MMKFDYCPFVIYFMAHCEQCTSFSVTFGFMSKTWMDLRVMN